MDYPDTGHRETIIAEKDLVRIGEVGQSTFYSSALRNGRSMIELIVIDRDTSLMHARGVLATGKQVVRMSAEGNIEPLGGLFMEAPDVRDKISSSTIVLVHNLPPDQMIFSDSPQNLTNTVDTI